MLIITTIKLPNGGGMEYLMKILKHIYTFIFTGFMMLCFLTSCSKDNIQKENPNNKSTTLNHKEITENPNQDAWDNEKISRQINENLMADLIVELPEAFTGEVKVWNAERKKLNKEKVLEIIFSEEANVEHPVEEVYYTDNKNLNIGSYLNYTTKNAQYYSSVYSPERCTEHIELPFMKIDLAKQEVLNLLQDIGLDNVTTNHIYTMTPNLMEQIEKEKTKDKNFNEDLKSGRAIYKGAWGDDDGCYVFEFVQSYDGIPLIKDAYVTSDDSIVFGGKIRVYYTNFGIEAINIDAIYDLVDVSEVSKPIDPSRALDLLKRKYDTIIMTDNMVVSRMNFTYIPILNDRHGETFRLIPVWDITVTPEEEQEIPIENHIYFNAVTGEEFFI